jgi:hypothetical protein
MPTTVQKIEVDAQQVLNFINGILPLLEASVPAVAAIGGPIGLGVSAAAAILPFLASIPIGTVYTVEIQQDILNRVQAINLLDFSGPQWQKSTAPKTPPVV